MRYVKRPVAYQITLTNTGDAPAAQTVLTDTVPDSTEFVAASQGGSYDNGLITWNMGTLAPGESRNVDVTLKSRQVGVLRNTATARAICADAQASAETLIRGIPAILLEVVDLNDPIEVGSNVTYEIRVLNQGSAVGTNIRIVCTLANEQEYVSAAGPTDASFEERTVMFTALPSLAPKATATFRVTVRGAEAGDVRFKVTLTSDQIKRPVEETESTHIY
jgi:uncharacterized repeat protein (TIGR01451 family)